MLVERLYLPYRGCDSPWYISAVEQLVWRCLRSVIACRMNVFSDGEALGVEGDSGSGSDDWIR